MSFEFLYAAILGAYGYDVFHRAYNKITDRWFDLRAAGSMIMMLAVIEILVRLFLGK